MKDWEVSLGYVTFKMSTRHPGKDAEWADGYMCLEFMGEN